MIKVKNLHWNSSKKQDQKKQAVTQKKNGETE